MWEISWPRVSPVDSLLTTLIKQLQVAGSDPVTKAVVRRFVRSVARVFVVFNVEMAPGGGKKKAQSATQPLTRCKKVFQVRFFCVFRLKRFLFPPTFVPMKWRVRWKR